MKAAKITRAQMLSIVASEHGGAMPLADLLKETAERFRIVSLHTLESTAYRMVNDGQANITICRAIFSLPYSQKKVAPPTFCRHSLCSDPCNHARESSENAHDNRSKRSECD
jgi:DNA-binding transcriptional LysR family regulator